MFLTNLPGGSAGAEHEHWQQPVKADASDILQYCYPYDRRGNGPQTDPVGDIGQGQQVEDRPRHLGRGE